MTLAAVLLLATGLVPITDLGTGTYLGFQGGLYPGGLNEPPPAHQRAAIARAAEIVPRNAAGDPAAGGLIGMIAVGMSNTTHEFGAFERNEDRNRNRNARLVLMDTGFGGQTAAIIANPAASYWTTMAQRLSAMGLTAAQVQVAWLKEADAQPPNDFPGHATVLRDELAAVIQNLHDKFPNLKLCYLSSRIYGGYSAQGTLNPEPQAYESGFAVKWLIEDQIASGSVGTPLLLWGPYLWADGTTPRSDGLTWLLSDLEADHVHPSAAGEQKVAGLLSSFFARESTAAAWWPARTDIGLTALDAGKDAHVSAAAPGTNFGSAVPLLSQGGTSPITAYAGFAVSATARPVALAKLSLRVVETGGGRVSTVADTAWGEGTITYATAPAVGAVLVNMPQSSRDGTIAANVTGNVNADADALLSYALDTPSASPASYHDREDADPPRLILGVSCALSPDADGDTRADPCDCAPADGSSFAVPREVVALRFVDHAMLAWSSSAAEAGAGTSYDLLAGQLSSLPQFEGAPGDSCAGAISGTQTIDPAPPPSLGEGRWYLVRAVNACGTSRWETSSGGRDRSRVTCP
ncbi:MAG TPA: hypothetical protein VJ826_04915 [Candidatus Polarisedimenticolaceae bacterium]|nr:hypothetical protein [Candidatus Polarisedimenticolaceae bacterium]